MKTKGANVSRGVQELCRKLKLQLDELSVRTEAELKLAAEAKDAEVQRQKLMDQLKQQLAELSR